MPPDIPDLDPSALRRLRRFGGEKLLAEMIALFADHAPARLVAARNAFSRGDSIGIKSALHALKSSAGQLGAARMHALCSTGERLARDGQLTRLEVLLNDLASELPRVQQWLESELREAA
jgi:HPt (histidine-containing phosphotransfer) domain-containing protein